MTAPTVDQVPLPVVPDGAAQLGPLAWLVSDGDSGGRVFIGGQLSHAWGRSDAAGRRLAAASLVRVGAARQTVVAAAFGVTTTTVYRWRRELDAGGMAGLAGEAMGPKGPSKLTGQVAVDIRARRAAGQTIAQVAAAVGVSVRSIARLLADDRAAAAKDRPTGEDDGHAAGDGDGAGDVAGLWDVGEGSDAGADTDDVAAAAAAAAAATDDDADSDVADDGDIDTGAAAGGVGERDVPLLPAPRVRGFERGLARFGLLGEAEPRFFPAGRVPLAGLLLAIPALAATGLIDVARKIYGALPNGFYGLSTMLTEAVFRALIGCSRAEATGRIDPAALGRVLGMDRSPEVKTIRRKTRQLAGRRLAAGFAEAMAAFQLRQAKDDDTAAVLYVDGHVRTYHGTRKIQKTHVARLRFPAPATVETWINDAAGNPIWQVMAEPGASLAAEISRLLPDVRRLVGDDRRVLVGFDRGGWSPRLFADMISQGFDVLTWRKGHAADIATNLFDTYEHVDDNGNRHKYVLADTTVTLLFDERKPDAGSVTLRQVTKQDPDTGRQIHVLTSRQDLPAAEVCWRLAARWRQENWFRFGRMRFDLDAHDTYQVSDDDGERMVPNPAKKDAHKKVQAARARLKAADIAADGQFLALSNPPPGVESIITSRMANEINQPIFDAEQELDEAKAAHRATPTRLPLSEVRPGQQILETETKQITHVIRAAAFNTQTALAATVRTDTGYSRAADEAHTLIRTALAASGDIDPDHDNNTLHIRLDPLPTPRASRAISELCDTLNRAQAVFPGTNLKMHYTVKTDK